MTQSPTACLDAALEYLRLGWSPIPVCPPDHAGVSQNHLDFCKSPGKAPIASWKSFQSRLATEGELRALWGRCPASNVGIVTGRISNMVAIDVDGQLGHETLLRVSGGDLPETVMFHSGREGSYRLIYSLERYTGPVPTIPISIAGQQPLKILGDGAQTVAPPSMHANGEPYVWCDNQRPTDRNPARMPKWLADMLLGHQADGSGTGAVTRQKTQYQGGDPIPAGGRNEAMCQLAGSMRRFGATADDILAALQSANRRCVDADGNACPLSDRELQTIARSVARYEPARATQTAMAQHPAEEAGHPEQGAPTGLFSIGDIDREHIEWLWPNWIPKGKLTILEGHPGLGKSQMMIDLCARLSRGDVMPDGSQAVGEPSRSIIMTTEDGYADTVKPRCQAAGADESMIFGDRGTLDADGQYEITQIPGPGVKRMERLIEYTKAVLLVLDPFSAYLNDKIDSHKEHQIRKAMSAIADVAQRTGCAIILMRHLTKGGNGNSLYRGLGSVGTIAAARGGIVVDKHPSDESLRVAAVFKSNLAAIPMGWEYRIEPANGVSRIVWTGESLMDHQALADAASGAPVTDQRVRELDRAVSFIRSTLVNGEAAIDSVLEAAEANRVSRRTLFRAANEIGIIRLQPRTDENPTLFVRWRLPSQ